MSSGMVFANPVIVDGKKISDDAYIKNGSTMLEFRTVLNSLGIPNEDITWDAKTKTITAFYKDKVITMKIGSKEAIVNGKKENLNVAPEIKNGKTQVPLRFLNDVTGSNIKWDSSTKTVTITTDNSVKNSYNNNDNTINSGNVNNSNNTTTVNNNSNNTTTNSNNTNSYNTTINVNGGLDKETYENVKNQANYTENEILTACDNGDFSKLRDALNSEAKLNWNARESRDGWTFLHFVATEDNQIDLVKKLVAKGANINAKTNKGETPMHIAVIFDQDKVLNEIHNNGGNPNIENNLGKKPWDLTLPGSNAYYTLAPFTEGAEIDREKAEMMDEIRKELGL